jgi:hypothetical protein
MNNKDLTPDLGGHFDRFFQPCGQNTKIDRKTGGCEIESGMYLVGRSGVTGAG